VDPDTFGVYNTKIISIGTPKAKRQHKKATSMAEDLFQLGMDLTELKQRHANESIQTDCELNSVLASCRKTTSINAYSSCPDKRRVDSAVDGEEVGPHETAADGCGIILNTKPRPLHFSPPRTHLTFSESSNGEDENAADSSESGDGPHVH
jgi:hypothetical protein